jgi:hypothetical protein
MHPSMSVTRGISPLAPTRIAPFSRTCDAGRDAAGDLNLAERLAARLGEWVGALSDWWMPEYAPLFAGNVRPSVRCAEFAGEPIEYLMPADH